MRIAIKITFSGFRGSHFSVLVSTRSRWNFSANLPLIERDIMPMHAMLIAVAACTLLPALQPRASFPPLIQRAPLSLVTLSLNVGSAPKVRRTRADGSKTGDGGAAADFLVAMKTRMLKRPPENVLLATQYSFSLTYEDGDINALWAEAVAVFGDEASAASAAMRQPTILNPSYTWRASPSVEPESVLVTSNACRSSQFAAPRLMTLSKEGLITSLGSESAALDVMQKNPAVLQCGKALATEPPSQILALANFRNLADSVPKQASSVLVGGTFAAGLLTIALMNSPDGPDSVGPAGLAALAVLKPVLGVQPCNDLSRPCGPENYVIRTPPHCASPLAQARSVRAYSSPLSRLLRRRRCVGRRQAPSKDLLIAIRQAVA